MSFSNAVLAPRVKALDWRIEPVPAGAVWKAWCAGPLRIIEAHFGKDVSKPCRHWMSNGELDCYCLREPASIRTIGYLPIITEGRRQVVVICPKTTCAEIQNIQFGEPVTISRGSWDTAPTRVSVRTAEWNRPLNHMTGCRYKSADIREYLFHVWQDKELTIFMKVPYHAPARTVTTGRARIHRVNSAGAVVPISPSRISDGTAETPCERPADRDASGQAARPLSQWVQGIGIDPNAGG